MARPSIDQEERFQRARAASSVGRPQGKPKVTGFVYLAGFMATMGGFLFGYDMGVVSSAMIFISDQFHLKYATSSAVISVALAACAVFSLVAGWFTDRFGRKLAILLSSAAFTVGAILMALSYEEVQLFIARVIIGAAVGFASMTVPAYIAEATPAHVRGLMVTGFQWMITFGFFFASVLGGVFSIKFTEEFPYKIGWRLMVAVAAIPSIIQFIGFFFMPESPRWLIENKRNEEALTVLRRIYGGAEEWVQYEYDEIVEAKEKDDAEKKKLGKGFTLLFMLRTNHVRKALIFGCLLQAFQQLSGINTLMFYTGTIMKMAGMRDNNTAIWMSCAVTGVNFVCTVIPILLVERMGRRKLLLASMLGVIVSLAVLGVGFLVLHNDSAKVANFVNPNDYAKNGTKLQDQIRKCAKLSNCDACVTIETCGFCYFDSQSNKSSYGTCLPNEEGVSDHSLIGNCTHAADKNPPAGITWADVWCNTSYAWIVILGMILYLCSFSSGLAPVPWVINAEIYPSWARSTGAAWATFFNWVFNLIITQTFLQLTEVLNKYGAFFLYLGITCFSFVLFFIIMPETKGLQIEEIELLFMEKNQRERAMSLKRGMELQNGYAVERGSIHSGKKERF